MLFEKPANTVTPELEEKILKTWEEEKTFQKSVENREGSKKFIFYEGPPTANGTPHPGHVLTKAIKDLIPRYKTMKGYQVPRKAGWDTHGLPVELEVEKQLGLENKQDIEKYGIEKFIKKCRESVFKYEGEWREMVTRGGFWIDMESPYITCENNYIETVWWMLSEIWKKGMLYEGHKIVPYCPRCGTALSSHEVAQGYKEAEDPSVYIKFALSEEENTYFLVWTTTPWTLISNVALAVGKDVDYVKVKLDNEYLILAKALLRVLDGKGEVVEEFKGESLLGKSYKPLYDFVKPSKKAHFVIEADFVSTEDGTGIVHIAPAFGEDDYRVGRENNLPVIQPVDSEGKFTEEVVPLKGTFVKHADPAIMANLKERNQLFASGTIKHTYPFCWRCSSPLLYYARHSWFVQTTAMKDEILKNNGTITWYPGHIKEGRFLNFLENMIDWAISRDRYWGTPLPIWICNKCEHMHVVDSIATLREMGDNVPEDLELHRPYIDAVKLKCPNCDEYSMERVPSVLDCWFDSGAMHTAQWHYPFENKDVFESNFPADWICEAVDQTRGWFYSLLVTSTFLHGVSPYKSVTVLGLICDKNGIKMSKSKGNVLDTMKLFDTYGADAVRWSLYSGTAPWNTRRFYEEAISDAQKRYLGTLQNVYSFFVLYANIENFNPVEYNLPYEERPEIDRWIISRLNSVAGDVSEALDKYEIVRATEKMEKFVDDLSNWYVRRCRRRFWGKISDKDTLYAFTTLYEVLVEFAKITAPFTPFIAEDIYRNLVMRVNKDACESVHLCDFPEPNEKLIDETLQERMELVMKAVRLGRAARNVSELKVRQPLAEMRVTVSNDFEKETMEIMGGLIDEELNVKKVVPVKDLSDLIGYRAKPNFSNIGKGEFRSFMPKIKAHLETANAAIIKNTLEQEGKYSFEADGNTVVLQAADIEIIPEPSTDYEIQTEGTMQIALSKVLTDNLILEGYSREIVNKIQNLRKEQDFEVMDRIKVAYRVTEPSNEAKIAETFEKFGDYIANETLAIDIIKLDASSKDALVRDINGIDIEFVISKEAN